MKNLGEQSMEVLPLEGVLPLVVAPVEFLEELPLERASSTPTALWEEFLMVKFKNWVQMSGSSVLFCCGMGSVAIVVLTSSSSSAPSHLLQHFPEKE
jgi:hypothetical protein